MDVMRIIYDMIDVIPKDEYTLLRQMRDIKKEMLYIGENSGWDAVIYVISKEIPYPPREPWHMEVLSLYTGNPVESIGEMYMMN